MREDIKNRWAVVTGADSGIGLCFCHELARRGCKLLMISNREESLRQAAADISTRHKVETRTLMLDLCRSESAPAVMQYLEEHWIEPLILINNAGIFSFREVIDTPRTRVNAFIDLHVRAVTELSRLTGQKMATGGEGGYILNMSSMACWTPMPGIALYAATKAYIRVFSRALGYELRPRKVKVMAACPGGIATDLFGLPDNLKRLAVSIGALDTPAKFVRKALNRLLRGKRQYINGLLNRIGIFVVAIAPTPLRMMVKTRMLDRGITR